MYHACACGNVCVTNIPSVQTERQVVLSDRQLVLQEIQATCRRSVFVGRNVRSMCFVICLNASENYPKHEHRTYLRVISVLIFGNISSQCILTVENSRL